MKDAQNENVKNHNKKKTEDGEETRKTNIRLSRKREPKRDEENDSEVEKRAKHCVNIIN